MPKILILLSLLSVSIFFTINPSKEHDIEYLISNKFVKDSTDVEITLKNNSSRNYYLLLDTLIFNDNYAKFESSNTFMWSALKISDPNGKVALAQIENYDCQNDFYYKRSKEITTKSFLKIMARESITFRVPFKIKTSITSYCWQKYILEQRINKSYYKIYFESLPVEKWINQNSYKVAQDSLRKMGYELYNKKITSNKVPLLLR